MILYSVTVAIESDVHEEWIAWMKSVHIPDVMSTGCFVKNKILKILDPPQEGNTYSFQYFAASMEKLDEYKTYHAPRLQADTAAKYPGKFAAFRTVLEVIEENGN